MKARSKGRVRLVIYIDEDLYISVIRALTPDGETTAPYGAISAFFNKLTEHWFVRSLSKEQVSHGSN